MDVMHKQVLFVIAMLFLSLAFVFSGLTDIIHNAIQSAAFDIFVQFARYNGDKVAVSMAYTIEILLASLMMITPMSLISTSWLLKIAYELAFGRSRAENVFIFHPVLNGFAAFICLCLAIYSIYMQYKWAKKFAVDAPKKMKDKDLARLI